MSPSSTRSPTTNPWSGPIWVVKNRAGAHDVLQAFNDPVEGDGSVEKTYSENMRPTDFSMDTLA